MHCTLIDILRLHAFTRLQVHIYMYIATEALDYVDIKRIQNVGLNFPHTTLVLHLHVSQSVKVKTPLSYY